MKVFVYGTLINRIHGTLLGTALTVGKYHMFDGGFPMVISPKNLASILPNVASTVDLGLVKGQLWEVDEDQFESLDAYEGAPEFYKREEIPVVLGEDEHTAWMYFGNHQTKAGAGHQAGYRKPITVAEDGSLTWRIGWLE